jgi:hypothetical protein
VTSIVSLSGTGMSPAPAQFALSPLSHDYGWIQQGRATADFNFILKNVGGSDSGVPSVKINGTDAADFGFPASTGRLGPCPAVLKPTGVCTISVHLAPQTAMATMMTGKSATLDVTGNPGGAVSATLTGNATVAFGLEISPPHHDFGSFATGKASPTTTFTVTNISAGAISAMNFATVAPGIFAVAMPQDFVFDTSDCLQRAQGFLDIGASCTVTVFFQVPAGHTGSKQLNWQVTAASRVMPNQMAQATAHVQGFGTP